VTRGYREHISSVQASYEDRTWSCDAAATNVSPLAMCLDFPFSIRLDTPTPICFSRNPRIGICATQRHHYKFLSRVPSASSYHAANTLYAATTSLLKLVAIASPYLRHYHPKCVPCLPMPLYRRYNSQAGTAILTAP
jgi:hypothetical protein